MLAVKLYVRPVSLSNHLGACRSTLVVNLSLVICESDLPTPLPHRGRVPEHWASKNKSKLSRSSLRFPSSSSPPPSSFITFASYPYAASDSSFHWCLLLPPAVFLLVPLACPRSSQILKALYFTMRIQKILLEFPGGLSVISGI